MKIIHNSVTVIRIYRIVPILVVLIRNYPKFIKSNTAFNVFRKLEYNDTAASICIIRIVLIFFKKKVKQPKYL